MTLLFTFTFLYLFTINNNVFVCLLCLHDFTQSVYTCRFIKLSICILQIKKVDFLLLKYLAYCFFVDFLNFKTYFNKKIFKKILNVFYVIILKLWKYKTQNINFYNFSILYPYPFIMSRPHLLLF